MRSKKGIINTESENVRDDDNDEDNMKVNTSLILFMKDSKSIFLLTIIILLSFDKHAYWGDSVCNFSAQNTFQG
jgi:hypothetical protein